MRDAGLRRDAQPAALSAVAIAELTASRVQVEVVGHRSATPGRRLSGGRIIAGGTI